MPDSGSSIPRVTTTQMVEVDRAMVEDLGIGLVQMMENAGRCLADLARIRFLEGDPRARRVLVLAGTGGNGGGALVAARRLSAWGAEVRIVTTRPASGFRGVPALQRNIVEHLGLDLTDSVHAAADSTDLVIDGIIGYSLTGGAPRGPAAALIELANRQPAPILSLDVPSGLDPTTGVPHSPSIRASATLTLALPKTGLDLAPQHVGELWLGDIGVPPGLYSRLGLSVGPIFATADVVRIR